LPIFAAVLHLANIYRLPNISGGTVSGKTVQLSDFFSHIRKQLFVRRDTRHSALLELRLLRQDIATMPDCNALSTRLKQIWLRFPTSTEELEPIRRHEACLFVHELLIYVKDLGFKQRKTVLHKAWHEFDFRSNDLFMAHFRDSSHETPAKSEIATAAYLTAVCDTLQASQEMYNRIHAAEPTLTDHSAKSSVLTLAADQLGITKQLLINRSGASSGMNGAKRKRPSAPSRPSKQANHCRRNRKKSWSSGVPLQNAWMLCAPQSAAHAPLVSALAFFAAGAVFYAKARPTSRVPFSALSSLQASTPKC
jgi:hypothetical protein